MPNKALSLLWFANHEQPDSDHKVIEFGCQTNQNMPAVLAFHDSHEISSNGYDTDRTPCASPAVIIQYFGLSLFSSFLLSKVHLQSCPSHPLSLPPACMERPLSIIPRMHCSLNRAPQRYGRQCPHSHPSTLCSWGQLEALPNSSSRTTQVTNFPQSR